jgi:hypothetical protein
MCTFYVVNRTFLPIKRLIICILINAQLPASNTCCLTYRWGLTSKTSNKFADGTRPKSAFRNSIHFQVLSTYQNLPGPLKVRMNHLNIWYVSQNSVSTFIFGFELPSLGFEKYEYRTTHAATYVLRNIKGMTSGLMYWRVPKLDTTYLYSSTAHYIF